ncbi:GGDEF domain-containing protein [Hydrocarboniphaga sp.]|uniref:GGDEF domain-containing protein n=1 Tax=Hydrocarboniphaga sp. TaxID=2033016 RepID=UPI003D0E0BE4
MEPDRWQRQYRETAEELEKRERHWRDTEELLRRIASRLCIAARGQHETLDETLTQVISSLRRPAEPAPLESLLGQLTQAVTVLDQKPVSAPAIVPVPVTATSTPAAAIAQPAPPRSAAEPFSAPPALTQTLQRLLDRLSDLPEAAKRAKELLDKIADLRGHDALAVVAVQVADLADAQAQSLRREKVEADRLLQMFNERLEDIAEHLRGETEERASAQADGQAFGRQLLSETEALYTHTREASDLASLQSQVYRRLTAIDQRVRDHRAREDARVATHRERNEALRLRIEELENQTQALSHSVRKLERKASRDGLTGVPNRAAYDERVATELAAWKRDQKPRSIAAFDVDHFKLINDQYGHTAGDKVLQVLAKQLGKRLRDHDFLARYGGEEFVLLLDDVTPTRALAVTDKLRQTIEKIGFHFRQLPVSITVSCGVTGFRENDTPESLFERADQALYQAKRGGRNRCCIAA